jgi:Glyoxalase/Bleomycin resistance protein/Dioxygenase superfamily
MSPSATPRPASGLFADPRPVTALGDLFANIWQLGYVTTDLERAHEVLRDTFGIEHIVEVPTDGVQVQDADGNEMAWDTRISMSARGGLILEVIEPVGGAVGFYRDALPADGSFGLVLHHLAVLVDPGDEAWERTQGLITAAGLRSDVNIQIPDRARLAYVDTRAQLGHWLELCQLQTADTDFFEGLTRDSA